MLIYFYFIFNCSKKRETRDREAADKQWTDMDVDTKKNDDGAKKNIEEKSVTPIEDLTPKINPIKWTVSFFFI